MWIHIHNVDLQILMINILKKIAHEFWYRSGQDSREGLAGIDISRWLNILNRLMIAKLMFVTVPASATVLRDFQPLLAEINYLLGLHCDLEPCVYIQVYAKHYRRTLWASRGLSVRPRGNAPGGP